MNRGEIITFAKSAVTNIFNGKGREPSPLEVETISKWINEMDYSVELIEFATTIAAKATEYTKDINTVFAPSAAKTENKRRNRNDGYLFRYGFFQ